MARALRDPMLARVGEGFLAVAVPISAAGDELPSAQVLVGFSEDLVQISEAVVVDLPGPGPVTAASLVGGGERCLLSWRDAAGAARSAAIHGTDSAFVVTEVSPSPVSSPSPVLISPEHAATLLDQRKKGPVVEPFPLVRERADPQVFSYGGRWYLVASDDTNGDNINVPALLIRSAPDLQGLAQAPDHVILSRGEAGLGGCFWAPEVHEVGGVLRLFFAPSVGQASWSTVQCHVMTLSPGGDPERAQDWSTPVPVLDMTGRPLSPEPGRPAISLDMTYLEVDGRCLVVWSQRVVEEEFVGDAELWIAEIDPAKPHRLTSPMVCLLTARLSWELTNDSNCVEGPYGLVSEDEVALVYAAGGVGPHYATGVLRAPRGADLMDPSVWTRASAPLLDSHSVAGQWGPGHVSFAHQGEDLILAFHAKSDPHEPARHTGLRRLPGWKGGQPVLL
ncbi:family 43 glycosylhydrolase [Kineosporia babensis]|uniref:Family 43 glycosylhydrolase n=1 Tax=Kineosporia babensis TaxID=499548 RepID=A0A9X1T4U2_9ACTN|nr:family 43 glycosylhydrolase [Kineosporia babensis]